MHLIVVKNLRQLQCRLMTDYAFSSMRRVGDEPGRQSVQEFAQVSRSWLTLRPGRP